MIKRLRIKFVVINMTIVTIMLSVILGLVLYVTKVQISLRSIQMMQELNGRPLSMIIPKKNDTEVTLPYLTVRLGPQGERISVVSNYYDVSNDAFIDEIVAHAIDSRERTGELDQYDLRYCFVDAPHNHFLIFSDISNENATMDSLLNSCILLGIVSFFVFLVISILLSGWAVKPIKTAMDQQQQFVADASHELKTPLTVLMANAQLLQSPNCAPERERKCINAILVTTEQMKTLTNELLLLARIDSLSAHRQKQRVDLSTVIQRAILSFEPVFFERGLTLSSEVQKNVFVNGYEDHISQLIDILLDNAQKYSTAGGTTRIAMIRSHAGHSIISVSNEGHALTGEQMDKLFKRFYRADPARANTGSYGLGLPIAKAIVTEHNGKIYVESKDGTNIFTIDMPCI